MVGVKRYERDDTKENVLKKKVLGGCHPNDFKIELAPGIKALFWIFFQVIVGLES